MTPTAVWGLDGGDWHSVAQPGTTTFAVPALPFREDAPVIVNTYELIDTGAASTDLTTIAPTVMSTVAWLPPVTGRLRMMTLGFPYIDQQ